MYTTSTAPFLMIHIIPRLTSLLNTGLLLSVFLMVQVSYAQKSFSTNQLLSKKTDNPVRVLLQDNLKFLRNDQQGLPLVDEMSFRTETDELDAQRQEYLLRMTFNTKAVRNLQDQKTKSNVHLYQLKDEILKEEELLQRYEHITKWYFADNELEWFAEKRAVLEDKRTVYKKIMGNALELDLDDLLKAEEDLQEMDQEMLQLLHEKNFSIRQLFPDVENPEGYILQAGNWITMETMQRVLEKAVASRLPNLEEEIQKSDIDRAQLDFDMEVAEADKVLDFVQLKYAGRDNLDLHREFSFGLSLIIPTKSTNQVNINEAQLDIFDEQFRLELLQQKIDQDLKEAYAEFDQLQKEYELIQQYIDKNQLEETYNKYKKNGTVHPLTLLRIKESMLKNKRELHKIEKASCLLFLDILTIKGLIGRTPTINYLSNDLNFF